MGCGHKYDKYDAGISTYFGLVEPSIESSSILSGDEDLLLFIESESDVIAFCLFIEGGRHAASTVHTRRITPSMMNIR